MKISTFEFSAECKLLADLSSVLEETADSIDWGLLRCGVAQTSILPTDNEHTLKRFLYRSP